MPHPNDALFKSAFADPEHAAGELRLVLPPALVARMDFASLQLVPGSYIEETLTERQSDLLFSVAVASRPALVYVLCEHQSSVDRFMAFRLLRYIVLIWERQLADNPRAHRLPAVFPVVVHHSATGWTAPIELADL